MQLHLLSFWGPMRVRPSLGFYFVITIIIIFPFPLGGGCKMNGKVMAAQFFPPLLHRLGK